MIDVEDSSATSAGAKSVAGLDAGSDEIPVLDTNQGTPKVRALSDVAETNHNLKLTNDAFVSCRDYLHVPVSKVRSCHSDNTMDRRKLDQQPSEPRVQTFLSVKTPGGRPEAGRIVADLSLGFFCNQNLVVPLASPIIPFKGSSASLKGSASRIRPDSKEVSRAFDAAHSSETVPVVHVVGKADGGEPTATARGSESPTVERGLNATQAEQDHTSTEHVTASKASDLESLDAMLDRIRKERPLPQIGVLPRCVHHDLESHKPSPKSVHDTSKHTVLHSSIPISKMRPFFDPLASTYRHGDHGLNPTSKIRQAALDSRSPQPSHNEQISPALDSSGPQPSLDEQISPALNSSGPQPSLDEQISPALDSSGPQPSLDEQISPALDSSGPQPSLDEQISPALDSSGPQPSLDEQISPALDSSGPQPSLNKQISPALDSSGPKLSLNEQSDPVASAEPKPANWERAAPVPASSSTSDNNPASGSLFDHKRTKKWLKDVLKYPENDGPRYTRRLNNINRLCNTSSEQDRHSETVLASRVPLRCHERSAVPCERQSPGFDRLGFKRAVSDLERLLSEALAIASHVVDQPASSAPRVSCKRSYKQPSLSQHSHCRSLPSQNETMRSFRPLPCSASADGSGGDYFESSAAPIGSHWETAANTPLSKSQSLVSRSKVGESIPPGPRKAAESNGDSAGHDEVGDVLKMPRRKSNKKLDSLPPEREDHADTQARPAGPAALVRGEVPGNGLIQPYNAQNRNLRHTGRRVVRSDYGAHRTRAAEEAELPLDRNVSVRPPHMDHGISLHRRSHVSLRGAQGFSLAKSHKRQPVARDWSPFRKRFVASVACLSTALVGIILGIYFGLVPSIQYYIIDQSHMIIHGNTACFLGLAIPTFFLWPLPLLHGRKPYVLSGLVLAMPLLFPQALAVNSQRLTTAVTWRCFLLAARAVMGLSLGFASMNFHSTLTDVFGASLMSCNPHQEVVDRYDARRHGGGMGVWLGIWTWCWIGSLGAGFLIGACIIDNSNPEWGFYVTIIIIAVVLVLNVVCPEVRRSPYRRSVAEVRSGEDISRRVARGEVMMHRVKTGPKWWGQEVYHGIALNLEMLRQPGFAVMAIYSAWIYAQVVLIIVLLGSLLSRLYRRRATEVGLLVGVVALGALLAIPFQKANLFSRSRQAQYNSNLATLNRKVAWSSHLVRRTVFTLLLPLAGICYAVVSAGPPIHLGVPTILSGFIGFLSCLAIAECNGMVMEAFDCSDLSPAMTGRQKDGSGKTHKRTNYSSFPRVAAGFASIHSIAFIFAAGATALGGYVTRTLGQRVSSGVVAGILLLLTFLLSLVLIRFTEVRIVPKSKSEEMDRLVDARRRSTVRRASMPGNVQAVIDEEKAWRPAMIGNPTSRTRRMNIFELGGITRWQEIRAKNRLIDAGAHLNREAWDQGIGALDDQLSDFRRDVHVLFHGRRRRNRKLRGTGDSSERGEPITMRDAEREQARSAAKSNWRGKRDCALSRTPD